MTDPRYTDALVAIAVACAQVRAAAVTLSRVAPDEDESSAGTAIESCRREMLAALAAAPGLADVFVVPARL